MKLTVFAAYVAEQGGISPLGLVALLLRDSVEESVTGTPPVAHPPASCRALQMIGTLDLWLKRNKAELLAPSGNQERDRFAAETFDKLSKEGALRNLDPSLTDRCKPYRSSFAAGFAHAGTLVDQNTKADSTISGQK